MNLWANADPIRGDHRRADAEELITEIAQALATAGEYVARVDLQPTQRVVDFTWAARQAGRSLGIRVNVDVTIAKTDGTAELRVAGRHTTD